MNSMNPQHNETAGMQLPTPMPEQAAGYSMPENAAQNAPEQGPAAGAENMASVQRQGATMPAMAAPAMPVAQDPSQQGAVSNTTSSSASLAADDSDLIEKEWVNKAKQIVERTRDDPYRQSEQLTGVKVDYMQKRYGKTIKLSK